MKKRAIIFDFFGVLVSEVAPFWLREFFSDEISDRIKSTIIHHADLGILSEVEMFRELAGLSNTSQETVRTRWIELAVANSSVIERAKNLKSRFRLGLLSNAPSPFVRELIGKYNLETIFETIMISSEEGITKPDGRIYNLMLARMDVLADESVMIDDNIQNVQGAISQGIMGIHFTTPENFDFSIRSIATDDF